MCIQFGKCCSQPSNNQTSHSNIWFFLMINDELVSTYICVSLQEGPCGRPWFFKTTEITFGIVRWYVDKEVYLDSTYEAEGLVGWGCKFSLTDIQLEIFWRFIHWRGNSGSKGYPWRRVQVWRLWGKKEVRCRVMTFRKNPYNIVYHVYI